MNFHKFFNILINCIIIILFLAPSLELYWVVTTPKPLCYMDLTCGKPRFSGVKYKHVPAFIGAGGTILDFEITDHNTVYNYLLFYTIFKKINYGLSDNSDQVNYLLDLYSYKKPFDDIAASILNSQFTHLFINYFIDNVSSADCQLLAIVLQMDEFYINISPAILYWVDSPKWYEPCRPFTKEELMFLEMCREQIFLLSDYYFEPTLIRARNRFIELICTLIFFVPQLLFRLAHTLSNIAYVLGIDQEIAQLIFEILVILLFAIIILHCFVN